MGDDVAAAPVRVGPDRLAIGEGHEDQQADDEQGDRDQVAERQRARREKGEHARLGGVGHRRHHVAREDGEGLPFREALLELLARRQDAAEQDAPRPKSHSPEARGRHARGGLRDHRPFAAVPEIAGLGPGHVHPPIGKLAPPTACRGRRRRFLGAHRDLVAASWSRRPTPTAMDGSASDPVCITLRSPESRGDRAISARRAIRQIESAARTTTVRSRSKRPRRPRVAAGSTVAQQRHRRSADGPQPPAAGSPSAR